MSNEGECRKIANLATVIICGGKSSRMGQPKADLMFGPETALNRSIRILSEVSDRTIIVTAQDQKISELPQFVSVASDSAPSLGPLEGIAVGLEEAAKHGFETAFITGCDFPLIRPEFVRRLSDNLAPEVDIVLPVDDRFHHVLCAVYRTKVATTAQTLIGIQKLRPLFLTDQHPTRRMSLDEFIDIDPDYDSIQNMNTPAEYRELLRKAVSQQKD